MGLAGGNGQRMEQFQGGSRRPWPVPSLWLRRARRVLADRADFRAMGCAVSAAVPAEGRDSSAAVTVAKALAPAAAWTLTVGTQGGFEHGGMGRNMDGKDQGPGGYGGVRAIRPQMTDGIVDHLTRQLTLTDDEKAKIKPIVQADVDQVQKDAETRRQEMQKRFDDLKAKIRPLLTADQQKQLDQLPSPGRKPMDKDQAPGK